MTYIEDDIIPAFDPAFLSRKRYNFLFGGAGSGKSVAASQKNVLRAGMEEGIRLLVLRKVARTLRHSVFARVSNQINDWGLKQKVKINKSDMTIEFGNGSDIIFAGMDDPEKIKSIERIGSVWIEEATEFTKEDVEEIDRRLRGITQDEAAKIRWKNRCDVRLRKICAEFYHQIMFSFNPINRFHWLKDFMENLMSSGDADVHHSTYRDNPYAGEHYAHILQKLKERNPNRGAVYTDGEWGVLEGLIYGIMDYSSWPKPLIPDMLIYGLDFGFRNPTALVECRIIDGEVYIKELIYKRELINSKRIALMDDLGVSAKAPIYGDSEDPAAIEEMWEAGYNCIPAYKGKGSVRAGIEFVKSFNLHTTEDNTNLNIECENYVWDVDKNGKHLERPKDTDDHAMDALRYALFTHLRPRTEKENVEEQDLLEKYGHMVPSIAEEALG